MRIVITTQPVPFEHQIIRKHLGIPEPAQAPADAAAFADVAMESRRTQPDRANSAAAPPWRIVALMPLSDDQIRAMAIVEGVSDADALLQDKDPAQD